MNVCLFIAQTAPAQKPDLIESLIRLGLYALPPIVLGGYLFWAFLSQRKAVRQQGLAVGQMDEAVALQRQSVRREEIGLELAHQSLLMQQEQIRLLKKLAHEAGEPPVVEPLPTLAPSPPTTPRAASQG